MSRTRQGAPTTATNAQIQTEVQSTNGPAQAHFSGTLRLRGESIIAASSAENQEPARRIRWSEDVVDNEGMGKKSSKVCCIYHKPHPVGESSSESESSSDSDSDSSSDDDSSSDSDAKDGLCGPTCAHNPNHSHRGRNAKKREPRRRRPSPNAYEKMPKPSKPRQIDLKGTS